MARPVTRLRYLSAKAAAALLAVTSVNLGGMAGVLVARATLSELSGLPLGGVVRAFLGVWAVFVLFAMLAILWSSLASLRSRASAAAVGSVVGLFFLNFASLLFDGVQTAGLLSPFHYFRPSEVLVGVSQAADLAVLLAAAALCAVLAGWRFATRDLTA
jgi:ABC-2 type transport system permease protein